MINPDEQNRIIDSLEERRKRFLEGFERPFKCEKCSHRLRKDLREHKSEVHYY